MTDGPHRPGRRALLVAGGGTLLAAAGGALLGRGSGPGADDRPPAGAVGEFDVSAAAGDLPLTPLRHVSGPQSLSYPDGGGTLYALQVVPASVRLGDEDRAPGGRERRLAGDLCVSRLSASGALTGSMHLRGFGHGMSFGTEPAGGEVFLWVESDADPDTGYGRAVARVRFRDGAVVDSSSAEVRHLRPYPGDRKVHPTLDLAHRRVLVSRWTGRTHRYSVHDMDDFAAGRTEPLWSLEDTALREGETFQGCALRGRLVYQLTGKHYTDEKGGNPPSGGGDTHVSALDVRTGRTVGRRKVTVAPGLDFREPEGIAVRPGARPELCVAFSVKTAERRDIAVFACPAWRADTSRGGRA
ncbi:signaling protein [Streptomyces sp. NBC_00102]|uniref:phage baseplate protein n=1 Tax=Streptomyces sp. NBC_00102 TaxID=2975652 RepID=UPI00224E2548|nr:signaling protein [Streptomyces sp. NBC_00102]MCX5400518.1 signaling protein [Streptomyces sp. NBC_00102]